jgi:hypothetical protein
VVGLPSRDSGKKLFLLFGEELTAVTGIRRSCAGHLGPFLANLKLHIIMRTGKMDYVMLMSK